MRKTQCSGCGSYFSSTSEFDAHRIGQFGVRGAGGRRCMTGTEMEAAGFASELHPITDEAGRPTRRVWFRRAKREQARTSFAAVRSGKRATFAAGKG